ncbi:MAG: sigma 54-interacting transcriptional regulator [Syntrophales bacterium]|jgi:PAS domain S-box-containing protein|nr:sigma 54-interacting transcriptional regulator [Syntrophales bacterium]
MDESVVTMTPDKLMESNLFEISKDPLFNLIFNSVKDAILISDRNGIVLFINNEYTRLTGVEQKDILGKYVGDVRKGARLPDALRTGRPLRGIRRTVDNLEYIADVHPIIINSVIIGGISVMHDITEIVSLSNKIKSYSSKIKEFHKASYSLEDIIGVSIPINKIKKQIQHISFSDASVIITGESGTGKELFAHAIHNASTRKEEAFVAVNCAAFSAQLLLSELFGYEQGAFTGAQKGGKLGLFEIANNGTLFLDEIGDMELDMQSKILRVLENHEFIKVGGTKPIKVDVRIISATNKDINQLIADMKFRSDLFYRLNVAHFDIPPLRSRPGDIPLLIFHCLKKLSRISHRTLTIAPTAIEILTKYNFPGNVRELFNILEFAASSSDDGQIEANHLPIVNDQPGKSSDLSDLVRISERELIGKALSRHENSVKGKRLVALELGVSLATLYNKIRQYGIALPHKNQ